MNLADFEIRTFRFSTQFFAEMRNANMDNPQENPLNRAEDEWVSAFIGWLMLVPDFEEPQPMEIPPTDPEVIPPPGED
jgi:hypothetical protein